MSKKNIVFPTRKAPTVRIDYAALDADEKIKKVSHSLANWIGDRRLTQMQKTRLKHIDPEVLVNIFDCYNGWQLYANRRIGLQEKVKIILKVYEVD
jgi:hypothetical protein